MYYAGASREAIEGSSSVQPGHELSHIRFLDTASGLIVRNPRGIQLAPDMKPVNEDLTKALFRLTEYGIEFPGVGSLYVQDESANSAGTGHVYVATTFVDGQNMYDDMLDVPLDTTVTTVGGILSYYEDMSNDFSDELYLTDISLRQCVYGISNRGLDALPRVNLVDLDPWLNNMDQGVIKRPPSWPGFNKALEHLDSDLRALKTNYPGEDFGDIASRLLALAARLGLIHRVPIASLINRNGFEGAQKNE